MDKQTQDSPFRERDQEKMEAKQVKLLTVKTPSKFNFNLVSIFFRRKHHRKQEFGSVFDIWMVNT